MTSFYKCALQIRPRSPGVLRSVCRHLSCHNGSLHYDLVVVGGGIVGLATARELATRHPQMKIALVEKEKQLASHQSGNNSGVLHSGIYYMPGSLKAQLCVRGISMAYNYCDRKGIPYNRCGKVIVAVEDKEVPLLQGLYDRGRENGVRDLRLVNGEQLRELEPYCQGKVAIHSPYTGIVDWGRVARSYGEDFQEMGGHVYTNFEVKRFVLDKVTDSNDLHIGTLADGKQMISSRNVIACCGLHSDRVAQLSGCSPEPRVVPFRGEYLLLRPERTYLVKGNIYPVPNPKLPFLGFHFTPRMNGDVWLGPNALLALSREGYNFTDFNWNDVKEMARFGGLWKLVMKYWLPGSLELLRRTVLGAQLRQLQRFIPDLRLADITRGPAGVRAQAMDTEGQLVDDFVFDHGSGQLGQRMLHVRNAPSPAATSSLAIAEVIADKAQESFNWNS